MKEIINKQLNPIDDTDTIIYPETSAEQVKDLAEVAKTGDYDDLNNKPNITNEVTTNILAGGEVKLAIDTSLNTKTCRITGTLLDNDYRNIGAFYLWCEVPFNLNVSVKENFIDYLKNSGPIKGYGISIRSNFMYLVYRIYDFGGEGTAHTIAIDFMYGGGEYLLQNYLQNWSIS